MQKRLQMLTSGIAAITFIISFLSCAEQSRDKQPTYGTYLKQAGVIGEHELRHPNNLRGLNGSLSVSYFLLSGSVAGNIQTTSNLLFSWCPQPEVVISSEFPMSMLRVVKDNSRKQPTIEFVFDNEWLETKAMWDERSILRSENPNSIISFKRDHLQVIKIRISEEDLRKEPALPQF